MKRLSGQKLKAIVYKTFILGKWSAFQDPIPTIGSIIEQWVTDMLHMRADLVGPARLQVTLHQRYIPQVL